MSWEFRNEFNEKWGEAYNEDVFACSSRDNYKLLMLNIVVGDEQGQSLFLCFSFSPFFGGAFCTF